MLALPLRHTALYCPQATLPRGLFLSARHRILTPPGFRRARRLRTLACAASSATSASLALSAPSSRVEAVGITLSLGAVRGLGEGQIAGHEGSAARAFGKLEPLTPLAAPPYPATARSRLPLLPMTCRKVK
jgi:hypothetical protein